MRIIYKAIDKPMEVIETTERALLLCANNHIDGYKEYVYLNNNLVMVADEDGLLKDLPLNFYHLKEGIYPEKIVGDVIIANAKYDTNICDYAIEDLTENQIKYCNIIFGSEKQTQIKQMYQLFNFEI